MIILQHFLFTRHVCSHRLLFQHTEPKLLSVSTSSLVHSYNAPETLPFEHVVERLVDLREGDFVSDELLQLELLHVMFKQKKVDEAFM